MIQKLNILNLFILLFLFKFSHSKQNIFVLEGDSVELSINNAIEFNYKLFLIFHVRNCPYCAHALKVLKEKVIKHYDNDQNNIFFGSIDLNSQSNFWLGYRFNITKIPYIILIENKKMYHFESQIEESFLVKFINEEKNIEDALDIPEPLTFGRKLKVAVLELTEKIQFLLNKFGIKIPWNTTMTHIFLIISFGTFIYLETKMLYKCKNLCKFHKNKNIKDKKEEKEKEKDNKKDKNKSEKSDKLKKE